MYPGEDWRNVEFDRIAFEVIFDEADLSILKVYLDHSEMDLYPYLRDYLIDELQNIIEETIADEIANPVNDSRKYDWDPDADGWEA